MVCRCGNILGEVGDGQYVVRHKGREVIAVRVVEIGCERCHRRVRLEPVAGEGPHGA